MTTESVERSEVAYHEAGHAVVAYLLGRPVIRVRAVPEGEDRGGTYYGDTKDQERYLREADRESRYGGLVNPAARHWINRALMAVSAGGLAQAIVKRLVPGGAIYGLGGDAPKAWELSRQSTSGREAQQLFLDFIAQEARDMLSHPACWSAVERVAAALHGKDVITGEELAELVGLVGWPPED